MKNGKNWVFMCLLIVGFLLSGCGGGGGGNSGGTSSTPSSSSGGRSAVSGIVQTGSSTRSIRGSTNNNSEGKATLIVDLDGDGVFGSSGDKTYYGVVQNGLFSFSNVEVKGDGKTSAKLIVNENNYAPYEKIIELENGGSVSVYADLKPVEKVTATVNRRAGGYLVFGIKKNSSGPNNAFVKRQTRADVDLNGTEATIVVPVSSIPAGINQITASLKRFDGSNVQQFPGEFKGTGYPATKKGDESIQLKSIAFLYADFTDQNGSKIKFTEQQEKRDGSCSNLEVSLYVPNDQIGNLKDDILGNSQYDVPVWRYNPDSGLWEYITEGELYNSNGTAVPDNATLDSTDYYVEVCLPPRWTYCNLDYGVWIGSQPKQVSICVTAKDQDGNPVSGALIYAQGNGESGNTYIQDYTDVQGKASLEISIPGNATDELDEIKNDYEFYYESSVYNWTPQSIDLSQLQQSASSSCDYQLNITIRNPFDAKIQVIVKDQDGKPLKNKWVEIWDNNYYYKSQQTDDNGEVIFDVQSNTLYTINALGQTKYAEVNSGVDYNESSDNGQVATITIQQPSNTPPKVSIYLSPQGYIRAGTPVNANVYATDIDGDNLTLKAAEFGNVSVIDNCTLNYSYKGYASWDCKLDTTGLTGDQTFSVTVSDNQTTNSTTNQAQTVTITSENRPPQVYGVAIYRGNEYVSNWSTLKLNQEYRFVAYAWDPDGDNLSYSWQVNTTQLESDTYTFTSEGYYTITVTAFDGKGGSATYPIQIHVGNAKPVITAVNSLTLNPQLGGLITVFAYAYDPDGTLTTDNFEWKIDDQAAEITQESYDNNYYNATIQLPDKLSEDGYFKITLTVTDNDGASVTKSFNIWVNKPPQIDIPLQSKLQLNKGDSHEFTISAHDPDGDELAYNWYVKYGATDWQKQSETSTHFTYVFNNVGTYYVKAVVSDGMIPVATICQVEVKSVAITNKLVLHSGIEGLYVTIHDPDTLVPITTKQTDSNGDVEFNNINGNVAVSLSITPDMVMNKDMVFNVVLHGIMEMANPPAGFDVDQAIKNGKISLEVLKASGIDDPDISESDVINADTNKDGYLNKDELYQLALSKKDKNGDGKLEVKEIEEDYVHVHVEMVRAVPAGEYDLTTVLKDDFEDYKGYNYAYSPLKHIAFTVKNVPAYDSITIIGPDHSFKHVNNSESNSADLSDNINLYGIQNNDKYSLIFAEWNNDTYTYLLNLTADNVSVDYNEFEPMKEILLKNRPLTENSNSWVEFDGRYKGTEYRLPIRYHNDFIKVADVPFDFDKLIMNAATSSYSSSDGINYKFEEKGIQKIINELPDEVDFNSLSLLDITINGTDTGVNLSGSDLDKINEYEYEYEMYKDTNDGEYSFYIDLDGYGNPGSTLTKPDFSQILPAKVWAYVKEIQDLTSYNHLEKQSELSLYYYPDITSLNQWIQIGVNNEMDWISSSYVDTLWSYSEDKPPSGGDKSLRNRLEEVYLPKHSLFHEHLHHGIKNK